MLGTVCRKAGSMMALVVLISASALIVPAAYGQPTQSLRSPLIPGAPSSRPYQSPAPSQPPPIGDGFAPAPVIPGDMGGPIPPPSGTADATHGNIFGTRAGSPTDFPAPYVDGAGRRFTQAGQQSGLFEFGAGPVPGSIPSGPGGPMFGQGWFDNGGSAPGASGRGAGGTNGGTGWFDNGGSAPGATGMGGGGTNGGTGWFDNGGSAPGATGRGGGGSNGGTGWFDNGGSAPGATAMGAGGSNGGIGTVNNGGAAPNATGMGAGGSNGGTGTFEGGAGSGGTGTFEGGSGNGGIRTVNNGGNAGGIGRVNNGGPAPGAQASGDRTFAVTPHSARYDFNGPLPTVRTFARYLVILGVVSATVFMAMAAWSVVFGHPHGGSRIIGAAGGLLLLLAGYTIWKIVQMNTFHANSTGWESHYRGGAPQPLTPANPRGGGGGGGGGPFGPPGPPP